MGESLSEILPRVANPVEPFGLKLFHNHPLLSLFDGIGDGFRQEPGGLDQFDESPADEIHQIHNGLLVEGGGLRRRR